MTPVPAAAVKNTKNATGKTLSKSTAAQKKSRVTMRLLVFVI